MARIGFIGVGNMGGPMTRNLLKAGHTVKVFDLSEEAVNFAVQAGAEAAATVSDAAGGVEIVVTMLPVGQVRASTPCGPWWRWSSVTNRSARRRASAVAASKARVPCRENSPANLAPNERQNQSQSSVIVRVRFNAGNNRKNARPENNSSCSMLTT